MEYPVEIKANVEARAIEDTLRMFRLRRPESEERSIFFLEVRTATTPHALDSRGVVLRVRLGTKADCTLKLRPCEVSRLPQDRRTADEKGSSRFRIEWDWSGDDLRLSASLENRVDAADTWAAIRAGDVSPVPTTDHLELYQAYLSKPLETQALEALGPVVSHKWELESGHEADGRAVGHRLNIEEWEVAGGLHFLELSAREDDMAAARLTRDGITALCHDLGVPLATSQVPKTRAVLDHFSAHPAGLR